MLDSALIGVEVEIPALLIEQFLVFALFRDLSVLYDQNLIGFLNCAQSVGDHKGRSVLHQRLKAFLDEGFAFGVEI